MAQTFIGMKITSKPKADAKKNESKKADEKK